MKYLSPAPAFAAILVLFITGVVLATTGVVSNPHYDASATSGGLHNMCTDFEIDANEIFSATCNKDTDGTVHKHQSTVDLKPDTDESCTGTWKEIVPKADEVTLRYQCTVTDDKILEVDLNDMVKWDPSTGKLTLRSP